MTLIFMIYGTYIGEIYATLEFQGPTGPFILAPAEGLLASLVGLFIKPET